MKDSLYIAWRYIAYHRGRSIVLLLSVTIILYLPIALHTIVHACEQELLSRADSTPLLIGAKGSSLDLVIDSLYFESKQSETISAAQAKRVNESGFAQAIPLYTRFRASGHVIVGTVLEYFELRRLRIARGRQLTRLGECVLGAEVADALSLGPGGTLISTPDNLFDLAGNYPLKMNVVGVLARSLTPDDRAIFVDLKTAWVIQGLAHGHEDLTEVKDQDVLLQSEDGTLRANAKLLHYNEITDETIESFHFHGDSSTFPISAIIAVPDSRRSSDLLIGRFQGSAETCQIVQPAAIVKDLTATLFRIESVLNSVYGAVGLAAIMLVGLVFLLSFRLRQREMNTMFKLGCSRTKVAELLASEAAIVAVASVGLVIIMTQLTSSFVDDIMRRLIF